MQEFNFVLARLQGGVEKRLLLLELVIRVSQFFDFLSIMTTIIINSFSLNLNLYFVNRKLLEGTSLQRLKLDGTWRRKGLPLTAPGEKPVSGLILILALADSC